MNIQFDHIGIFVKNLSTGRKYLSNIFLIKKKSRVFIEPAFKVKIQFLYDHSGICYEIIAPSSSRSSSIVTKVLNEKKNILNHIAYKTKNLSKTIKKLRVAGFINLTNPKKMVAFKGKKAIFFLSPLGLIIELIEF
jgi:methylmalonyl-CoA/ethylmalonyl-CoA epimerase